MKYKLPDSILIECRFGGGQPDPRGPRHRRQSPRVRPDNHHRPRLAPSTPQDNPAMTTRPLLTFTYQFLPMIFQGFSGKIRYKEPLRDRVYIPYRSHPAARKGGPLCVYFQCSWGFCF